MLNHSHSWLNLLNRRLLRTNFDIMNDLGEPVMRPFLQDVVQFMPLAKTLGVATIRDPLFIPQVAVAVAVRALVCVCASARVCVRE